MSQTPITPIDIPEYWKAQIPLLLSGEKTIQDMHLHFMHHDIWEVFKFMLLVFQAMLDENRK